MVRSHAKTNTTQSTLTHYERSLLKSGGTKRLGGDAFKPLDHCYLCLSRLTDPVSCTHGHMFCRECAVSNLISQKAGIESTKRDLEQWDLREQRERAEALEKARERVVKNFERGMSLGIDGTPGRIKIGETKGDKEKDGERAEKEKFNLGRVEELAMKAEEEALRTIEAEQVEARKSKLAAFWLPSLAPEGRLIPVKDVKLETVCQAGKHPHPMSRKTLLPVQLTYSGPKQNTPTCPSCTKELSNATSSFLLSSRKPASSATDPADNGDEPPAKKKKKGKKDEAPYVCGHVVCKNCAETIVKPSGRCCVCEAEVDATGLIALGKEGTGFAAAGGSEIKSDRVAFRV